ncbi:MAG: glycosyl transferase [Ramlibacter sp.]
MQLIYFSPVPWASFRQRPHEFAEWFHRRFDARVLWVEPYPVRLPRWSDLSRLTAPATPPVEIPAWLDLCSPRALPLEPFAAGRALNRRLFWPAALDRMDAFAKRDAATVIAVGKPSDLALRALQRKPKLVSLYDAMDDFAAFHSGTARVACAAIERQIVEHVTHRTTSSSVLAERMRARGLPVQLVANGLAAARMPEPLPAGERRGFGYIGTIASWFDWRWVGELAADWPDRTVEIVGPVHLQPPASLPPNIALSPPLPHEQALARMRGFAAGLIPFRQNELTSSVDPVKYYEYRALGVPVISTPFGEMATRRGDARVLLTEHPGHARAQIAALLVASDTAESTAQFRQCHDWAARFEPLGALLEARS